MADANPVADLADALQRSLNQSAEAGGVIIGLAQCLDVGRPHLERAPMRASVRLIAAAVLLTVASSAFTQTCEITGNVPASIGGLICSVATSVHGGDAPVNQLTIIVTREMAFALRAKTPFRRP